MEKNNKGLWIAVSILIVLVLLLAALVAMLLFGKKGEKQGGTGNAGPFVVDEKKMSTEEDILGEEIEKEIVTAYSGITMVIDGFKFYVPADYDCFYSYDIGPVVYLDDIFQMKTAVRDGSYEEAMKDPDALMAKTSEAGGKILQDIKETELDGKKYAYFLMELAGDKCFVGYTQAADTDKRFGAQIVIESDNLTDEDLLHIFADVTAKAEVTDESDSTYDDIVAQVVGKSSNIGDRKEESTLRTGNTDIIFCVPENFYSQKGSDEEISDSEVFLSQDIAVTVDCYLESVDEFVENAKAAVEIQWDSLSDSVKDSVEIQKTEIKGTTCYYIMSHYSYNGSDYQKLYAACDVGEDAYFAVSASVIDEEMELSMDTIKDFFVFRK